jgi:hypothetical protein
MRRIIFLVGLISLLTSCGQRNGSETAGQKVTDKDIYEILEFVIKYQALDKNFGLRIKPGDRCDLNKEDKEFLTDLILESKPLKDSTVDSVDFKITVPLDTFSLGLQRCLIKEDVDYMLKQKETVKDFKWDNSRLGFDLDNTENWYEFSVPLFSADKSKAILLVSKLCKGLCGSEQTFLIEKEEGKLISKTGFLYNH